jgi:predicted TIM-barrel fold metal-dependent hydrolase
MLADPGWGWHIETAVHIIRMILGGVFDQYPKLQIVIGHLGEPVYGAKARCHADGDDQTGPSDQ